MNRVIVIGGGLTGTYAAYLAAGLGLRVEVFEASSEKHWRSTPLSGRKCGEGIWQRKLQAAGIEINLNKLPSWVENFTTTLLFGRYIPDQKITFLKAKIEPYLFLNRQKAIFDFQQRAYDLGAKWHFGKAIENLRSFPKNTLIIGAWGTNPTLLSQVVRTSFKQEYLLACQSTLRRVDGSLLGGAKTVVLSDDPKIRYFYLFPKGNSHSVEANVGVVFNHLVVKNPFRYLDLLLRLGFKVGIKKADLVPNRSFVKIVCAGPPVENQVISHHLLLVGDAGFTTDPVSIGGIGFGLLSAGLAVESLKETNPQKSFQEKMVPLWQDLKESYRLSKKFYPSQKEDRVKSNHFLWKRAKEVFKKGGYLSLGKIAREVLT